MEFNFTVRGDRITADEEYRFIEGNKKHYEAVFNFDENGIWNSGAKVCIIENEANVFEIPVINGRCTLPEMLRGSARIGVLCVTAEGEESERASTNMIAIGVQDGASGAEINAEMSTAAEVWEKYLSDMEENRAAAEEAKEGAETAKEGAETARDDAIKAKNELNASLNTVKQYSEEAAISAGNAAESERKADGWAAEAMAAANRAVESEVIISGYADMAIESAESIRNMTVSAESILPGNNAEVQKNVNDDGTVNLHYLIPRGEMGEKGDRGDKGDSFTYDDMTEAQKDELAQRAAEKVDVGGGNKNATIESLKYYGDANIFPSDDSLFRISEISSEECEISGTTTAVPEELVIPYQMSKDGKIYKVTKITNSGFQLTGAKHIIIPNTITSIGSMVFYMSDIDTITIPKSVKKIGNYAFIDSKVMEVYYEGSKSEWDAVEVNYEDNSELKNATIHYGYSDVTKEYVDGKIEEISSASDGGGGDSVTINNLKYYGDANIVPSDPSYFLVIESAGVEKAVISSGIPPWDIWGELVIPYEVEVEGKPWMVTEIYSGGGFGSSNIDKVVIPNTVEVIGGIAFSYCQYLQNVVLCGKMLTIGENAFSGCRSLQDIYYKGSQTEWENFVEGKENIPENVNIHYEYSEVTKEYVDGKNEDKLKLLHYYGDVNIVPASSSLFTVGTNGTIRSEGPAQDVTGVLVVPYECTTGGKVYEAVMVGEEGLSGVKANKVILPSSIEMIGAGCFWGSEALKELVICGKSFRVDEAAFEECQNFKDIYYRGTKSDWDTKVQGKNYIPSTVTIHYIGI